MASYHEGVCPTPGVLRCESCEIYQRADRKVSSDITLLPVPAYMVHSQANNTITYDGCYYSRVGWIVQCSS